MLGPRQVGKSFLLSSLKPDVTINLASPAVFRQYVARPELLEQELRSVGAKTRTVLLDEVQRVPPLLDVVQVLHDELPGRFRFLLSGSSYSRWRSFWRCCPAEALSSARSQTVRAAPK